MIIVAVNPNYINDGNQMFSAPTNSLPQTLPLTPKLRVQYLHDGIAPGIFNDIRWRQDLLSMSVPKHRFPFFIAQNF